MSRAEINNDRTILDYLNEDCWRVLLKYVPVRDLIRTERTSRHWQTKVLLHLQGVHINVVDECDRPKPTHPNACTLKLAEDAYESFVMWTSKLGPSLVSACCISLDTLKIIHDNCPNLETLMFLEIHDWCALGEFPYNLNKDYRCLQALYFCSCSVSDQGINQFIADKAIEELDVRYCNVKGDFLNTINLSNLKSLAFACLESFDIEHLRSAFDNLSELTKLVLWDMSLEFAEEIQYVFDKMYKLEYLEFKDSNWLSCYDFEPLSRLSRLKVLRTSFLVHDRGVEAILLGCKELRSLELSDCRSITGPQVANAFCSGAQLQLLTLHKFHCMEDDDLVGIIIACPELTLLVVSAADLSPALPARAAAARSAVRPRGPRLRLDLSDTILVEPEQLKRRYGNYALMITDYENLIIDLIAKNSGLAGCREICDHV